MITLDEARRNIGESVIYTQPHGVKTEDGVITSVGPQFVFVRYGNDRRSKATHPDNLELTAVAEAVAFEDVRWPRR